MALAFKTMLARVAYVVEHGVDKVRRGPAGTDPIIDCYGGYTTPDGLVLRGRVLAKARPLSETQQQSRWRNFRDFISLFGTEELEGVTILAPDYDAHALTDEEGFFTLHIPSHPQNPPQTVNIRAADEVGVHEAPVFASAEAGFGVISDIDDTLLRTGAFSLLRNLWISATRNVHEREIFADAARLLQDFEEQGACFFYVSSSPWNLHGYLQAIFARAGVPLGPLFLRDLGISRTQFITGTHGDHKTDAIETVLAAEPQLTFTLVGDTGQHDPHIYADIVSRHAARIDRVILRRPNDVALSDEIKADIAKIQDLDVSVMTDFDYRRLLTDLEAARRVDA